DALLLVACDLGQAGRPASAYREAFQLSILHQRRPGRHIDQPYRDMTAHEVVCQLGGAAERNVLQADVRLLGDNFPAKMSGRAAAPAAVPDPVAPPGHLRPA